MASIYDKSSLVLIPSGTKTGKVYSQKPVSGDGDFTFTRSSAATRVNADGFIEKETQNLLVQSNKLNTTWTISDGSIAGSQADKDGGTSAWKLTNTNPYGRVTQNVTSSGVNTFSIYAKAGNNPYLRMQFQSVSSDAYFDLSDGSVMFTEATIIDAGSESVGNGWYRVFASVNEAITNVRIIHTGAAAAGGGSTGDYFYLQDAQLEQGLVARDYIETTTTAVEGGITDNVPRLDYTDSSCPALLLEPQRTNLVTQSELLEGFFSLQAAAQIENSTTSPEGVQNAVKMYPTATGTYKGYNKSFGSSLSNTAYTLSVYAKAAEFEHMFFYEIGAVGGVHGVWFNLSTGNVGTTEAAWSNAKMTDMGDGWYRCEATLTYQGSADYWYILAADGDGVRTATASGTNGLYLYGAQAEEGSYATSYIPTYGSSVSRVQDEADAFNAGNLITDNEGVLFVEFDFAKQDVSQTICLNNNSPNNRIGFWTPATADLHIFATSGGTAQFSTDTGFNLVNGQTYKVAVKWSNNIVTAFANGNLIFTSSTIANPINLYVASMNNSTTTFWDSPVKQYMVFPTALTDQEAIDLTTI